MQTPWTPRLSKSLSRVCRSYEHIRDFVGVHLHITQVALTTYQQMCHSVCLIHPQMSQLEVMYLCEYLSDSWRDYVQCFSLVLTVCKVPKPWHTAVQGNHDSVSHNNTSYTSLTCVCRVTEAARGVEEWPPVTNKLEPVHPPVDAKQSAWWFWGWRPCKGGPTAWICKYSNQHRGQERKMIIDLMFWFWSWSFNEISAWEILTHSLTYRTFVNILCCENVVIHWLSWRWQSRCNEHVGVMMN